MAWTVVVAPYSVVTVTGSVDPVGEVRVTLPVTGMPSLHRAASAVVPPEVAPKFAW